MNYVMRKPVRDFGPGLTNPAVQPQKTVSLTQRCNFRFRKSRDCTICVMKTKALVSFPVTAQMMCTFVFAYAKSRLSHDVSHIRVGSCSEIFVFKRGGGYIII